MLAYLSIFASIDFNVYKIFRSFTPLVFPIKIFILIYKALTTRFKTAFSPPAEKTWITDITALIFSIRRTAWLS